MTMSYNACIRVAYKGAQSLCRRYLAYYSGMGLFMALTGCTAQHKAQSVDSGADIAEQVPQGQAPSPTKTKRSTLRDRPSPLIYKQAGEQARQHLTADNAHLRLDELDAQIEHEKEITR